MATKNTGHIQQSINTSPYFPSYLKTCACKYGAPHSSTSVIQICIYPNPHGADDSGENGTPVQLRYRVAVLGYHILSKLLSVNHEARRVAVTFYRVRIPFTFTRAPLKQALRAVTTVPQEVHVLPFNPEYDVLQVSVFFWPDGSTVGGFLLDLKALDPRGIGLRKLVLDVDDWPSHGEGPNRPPSPSTTPISQPRDAFVHTRRRSP